MDLKTEINEFNELEARIMAKVKAIVDALIENIGNDPLDGVKVYKGNLLCATVSSKTIFSSPNIMLSPDYYIPAAQANAVKQKLEECKSIQSICTAVKQMLTEKKVKNGNIVIHLNENTLSILRESELAEIELYDTTFTFDEIPLYSIFRLYGSHDEFIKLLDSNSPSNCICLTDLHYCTLTDKARVIIIKERS